MDYISLYQSLNPEQRSAFDSLMAKYGVPKSEVEPPPPAVIVKGVKFFLASGVELADGATITIDLAHNGKTVISGPPNAAIGVQSWQNGMPLNGSDPNSITQSYRLGPDGTLVIPGIGLSGGPTQYMKSAKVRVLFYAELDSVTGAAYDVKNGGFAHWELLGDRTVYIRHTDTGDWERKDAFNTYNPYMFPFLTASHSAAWLKISEYDWQALFYAAFHGTPIPADVASRNAEYQRVVLGMGFGPETA